MQKAKGKIDQVKADIWETDGIDQRLSNTSQMSGDKYSDIQILKHTNLEWRQEIALLKAIIIKDKKVTEQESEIVDLKGRPMRETFLIHNLTL